LTYVILDRFWGSKVDISQPEEIHKPTVYDTVLFRLPIFAYNQTVGRLMNKEAADAEFAEVINVDSTQEEQDAAIQAAAPLNAKDDMRRRKTKANR